MPKEPSTVAHSMEPRAILARWLPGVERCALLPVVSRSSFSGAAVWHASVEGRHYALRRWPAAAVDAPRLESIHALQRHLARTGPGLTPALHETPSGETFVDDAEGLWELADWQFGSADYRTTPSRAKLVSAMTALAQIHLAAANHRFPADAPATAEAVSTAMERRVDRLAALTDQTLTAFETSLGQHLDDDERRVGAEAVRLIRQARSALLKSLLRWTVEPLPLQWRLGDVHVDNVLFAKGEVSGVIDFGAASFDSPAGDVARLLGSMADDDPSLWSTGFAAYEAVRPLSPDEREATRTFDASGAILAAANWLRWLYQEPAVLAPSVHRPSAVARLRHLADRLRKLVD